MLTQKINKFILKISNIPRFLAKTIGFILIFMIQGLRPLLGPAHCKYPISCTKYAVIQLKTKPLFTALWLITKRLISCNPFFDPK